MQLSKLTYYSDFWVYPLVIATLAALSITHTSWHSGAAWLGAGLG